MCSQTRVFPDCKSGGVFVEFLPAGDVSVSNSLLQFVPLADDTYSACFKSGISEIPTAVDEAVNIVLHDDESSEVQIIFAIL